jgi:hypothetical protein
MSTREIGKVLGVSHTTVERDAGGTFVPPEEPPQVQDEQPTGSNVPTCGPGDALGVQRPIKRDCLSRFLYARLLARLPALPVRAPRPTRATPQDARAS